VSDELILPPDITQEENLFIELVKQKMLSKLDDRQKFIFLYCIELGHDQREAASVLNRHETNVARQMRRIRNILGEYRCVKNNN
jgi:DNA-directed RNA polymerase specialized sigma24 family protein